MAGRSRREISRRNLLVFWLFVSVMIGGVVSGYFKFALASMTEMGDRVVVPLDGRCYDVYGKQVCSDTTLNLFYIDNEPIYVGEVKKGIWLAHQKSDSGLFVFSPTNKFSFTRDDITPPESISIEPPSPEVGQRIYFHARGRWDTSEYYSGLYYEVYESDTSKLVAYGATTTRKRSGTYDTRDSSDPTIYRQLYTSSSGLSAGKYGYSIYEYYSGICKVYEDKYCNKRGKAGTFTVRMEEELDIWPPVITMFRIEPNTFEGDVGSVTAYADWSDRGKGVQDATVYVDGRYGWQGGILPKELSIPKRVFACGVNTVRLKVTDGVNPPVWETTLVTKQCKTDEDKEDVQPNKKWCEALGVYLLEEDWSKEKCEVEDTIGSNKTAGDRGEESIGSNDSDGDGIPDDEDAVDNSRGLIRYIEDANKRLLLFGGISTGVFIFGLILGTTMLRRRP